MKIDGPRQSKKNVTLMKQNVNEKGHINKIGPLFFNATYQGIIFFIIRRSLYFSIRDHLTIGSENKKEFDFKLNSNLFIQIKNRFKKTLNN